MQTILRTGALLVGALSLGLAANAQQHSRIQTDLAVTYSTEYAKVAGSGNSFWLQGYSADAAVTFYKGLGLAGNITSEYASNVASGVDFDKVSFLFGPRYTFHTGHSKTYCPQIFGEWLVGGVHGFNSVFPSQGATQSSTTAFAMQGGIGADVAIFQGFGLRLFEMDFVHTTLPNGGTNSQNNLRIGFGLSYRH